MYNEHLEEEALRRGMITPPSLIDVYVPPGNIPALIDFEPVTLDLKSNIEWILLISSFWQTITYATLTYQL
ncbi:MAG: hypothetical protein JTT15_02590 [Candidatus Brockarchaeota archaeon]|nr:hypothetical protein [Candidatus Brockarchaeota archaeon]